MILKKLAAAILPKSIHSDLRMRHSKAKAAALADSLRARPLKIVIGSSGFYDKGWIPTDAAQLNLLDADAWAKFLRPNSVDAMLAEHVWEHLTIEQGRIAAATCFQYLKPGGYIRVAVPDGFHPDPEYRKYISIGGVGGGGAAGGHLVVYRYAELVTVFESVGFVAKLLEYHDETGCLVASDWDPALGMIRRSKRFDARGAVSIVMDAVKAS